MISSLRMRHLEVLLAVAAAGSMQRAAQRVHLTQPAISKLIGEIEAIFGAAMFARSKRGVTLTECGRTLVARAESLLNDLQRTQDEIDAVGKGVIGDLRIGVLPVAESSILPKSLLALRKVAPALHIRIEEGTRSALLDSLRRGEIDCVIGRLAAGPPDPEFESITLLRLPVHIVARSAHPLTRQKRVTLGNLATCPWVLPRMARRSAP